MFKKRYNTNLHFFLHLVRILQTTSTAQTLCLKNRFTLETNCFKLKTLCLQLKTLCLTYQTKFQTHCKSVYYADIYSKIFDFPLNSEGYAFQFIVTFTA